MYLPRLLAVFFLGFIIYRTIKARLRKRRIRQKEAQLGCLPPPVFQLTNGLGLPVKKGNFFFISNQKLKRDAVVLT